MIRAKNFGVNRDRVSSSSAEFYWDAVDDDPLQVRGIFRGYQVSSRVTCFRALVSFIKSLTDIRYRC